MKTVYDMSTGSVLLTDPPVATHQQLASETTFTALRLQLVEHESRPEKPLPPELVMADLNAFLDKMS